MRIRRSTTYDPDYGCLRALAEQAHGDGQHGIRRRCALDIWSRLSESRLADTGPDTANGAAVDSPHAEPHILRGVD